MANSVEERLESALRTIENNTGTTGYLSKDMKENSQQAAGNIADGSKKTDDELQAADRKAWLYIGKLRKNTTTESLTRYLERNGIQGEITCEELNTLGDTKAFKVSFPLHQLKETEQPDFWPMGIRVRRFRFRKTYRDEGVDLE
ncbi:hypothetical protein L9F63_012304 [Diploptera punctata]|uniref:Uncharacterized protein n=1 Tax=Diploptera punctata TaxID=6984 RepID=A0AAD8ADG8_DIPPU|nr:hypothetical protein L9F63_012304 [Diploptera punctata]